MDFHSNFIHAISSCIVLLEWQMYSLSFFLDIAIEEFQRFLLSIKLQMISWPPPLFCIVCQPWGILFLLYLFSSEMSTHNIQFWVGGKRLEYTCLGSLLSSWWWSQISPGPQLESQLICSAVSLILNFWEIFFSFGMQFFLPWLF